MSISLYINFNNYIQILIYLQRILKHHKFVLLTLSVPFPISVEFLLPNTTKKNKNKNKTFSEAKF